MAMQRVALRMTCNNDLVWKSRVQTSESDEDDIHTKSVQTENTVYEIHQVIIGKTCPSGAAS